MKHQVSAKMRFANIATLSSISMMVVLLTTSCVPSNNQPTEKPLSETQKNSTQTSPTPEPTEQLTDKTALPTSNESDEEETEKFYPIKWDSYDIISEKEIKFHFLAKTAPDPCSSYRVTIKVDETSTTVDPSFTYKMPEEPSKCVPMDWSVEVTLKQPLDNREITR